MIYQHTKVIQSYILRKMIQKKDGSTRSSL